MLFPFNDRPPTPPDQQLDRAYRGACYEVNDYTLKIGQPHPNFDRWLAEVHYSTYLIVTAHNPESLLLPAAENLARELQLIHFAEAHGLTFIPSRASDPTGAWAAETGLCLLDVSRADGYAIGRRFAQNAVVEGERGGLPRLVWLR